MIHNPEPPGSPHDSHHHNAHPRDWSYSSTSQPRMSPPVSPIHRRKGLWPPGAAYRSAPEPPREFTAPLLPLHSDIVPKPRHSEPNSQHNDQHTDDSLIPERGINDDGKITIDTTRGTDAIAHSLGAQDEPTKYYWTFDHSGQPRLTRYNPRRRKPLEPGQHDSEPSSSSSNPLPLSGNRGLKLRPTTSLHDSQSNQTRPNGTPLSSSSAAMLTHAIDSDDEIITSNAPKWNAFGRLAPWTSGMTGPLTGTGEEQVGPCAIASAEEGDVGERRPRRGDRETNDRLRIRLAALQRAGVRSLITSSPPPRRSTLPIDANVHHRSESPLLPPSPPSLATLHRSVLGPSIPDDSHFSTSALAPDLLAPIVSPLDLLQSRTLRHTFKNPHLQALAKTTLDLGETDHQVSKSVGGFWAALEEQELDVGLKRKRNGKDDTNGDQPRRKESRRERRDRHRRTGFSPEILGARGCSRTRLADELNPAFSRLEERFITDEDGGLRIAMPVEDGREGSTASAEPQEVSLQQVQAQEQAQAQAQAQAQPEQQASAGESNQGDAESNSQQRPKLEPQADESTKEDSRPGEDPPADETSTSATQPAQPQDDTAAAGQPAPLPQNSMTVFLTPSQQREILLASLSCLHELASDSAEYSARLQEVRGRLSEVQRKRDKVWRALRIWAVRRVEDGLGVRGEDEDGVEGEPSGDGHEEDEA